MAQSDTKKQVTVKVDIRPGKGTDYQAALKRKFFARLISDCWRELKAEAETEGKHGQT